MKIAYDIFCPCFDPGIAILDIVGKEKGSKGPISRKITDDDVVQVESQAKLNERGTREIKEWSCGQL